MVTAVGVGQHGGMDWLVVLLVVVAALVAGAAGVVRVVPAGHRGVVLRGGRPVRSRPPGLLLHLPGAEQVNVVPLLAQRLDPVVVSAVTREGAEVRVVASLLWRVVAPDRAAAVGRDLAWVTAETVERELRRLLGNVDLACVLREREAVAARLSVTTLPLLGPLGVELVDTDLVDVALRGGPELANLLP